jgi:hypothetical protein
VLFGALLERLHDARVVTVLVIEDVHWADEATLDLLRFLARRIKAAPTLVVVTYRDDEVGPLHPVQLLAGDLASSAPMRRLRLAPLSRQAVAVLAGPHGVDPARCTRRRRGTPSSSPRCLPPATRRSGHGGGRGAGSGGPAVHSALNLRKYPLAFRYHDDGIRYCTEHDLDTWRLYMTGTPMLTRLLTGRAATPRDERVQGGTALRHPSC